MEETNDEPRHEASENKPVEEETPKPKNENGQTRTAQDLGKDEMTLVEYPISLVAERVPKRKNCGRCGQTFQNKRKLVMCPECQKEGVEQPLALVDLKKIEWNDFKTIEGQKVPQKWVVTGSDAHGLPTGPDNDILLAMLETARRAGFKDKNISLRNAYHILKAVAHTGGSHYERFIRAIPRWATLSVHTEYTLYDKDKGHYERKRGFNLFQEYDVITREQRATNTTPTGKRDPVVFGHVTMTDRFYKMVTQNLKDLDLKFYKSLSSAPSPPVTKKLYRYLDKKRWYGGYFAMDVLKLCRKLGFDADALTTYMPAKIRGMLTPSLQFLKDEKGFLRDFSFKKTPKGQKLVVYFAVPGTAGDEKKPFGLDEEQLAYAQVLANDIAEVLGQADKNKGFYFKTAAEAVRDGTEHSVVRSCLSETKLADHEGRIETTKSQYFNACLEEKTRQINLPFDQKPPQQSGGDTTVS